MKKIKIDKVIILITVIITFVLVQLKSSLDSKEAASIGIIGGADGPTAIFIASKVGAGTMTLLAVVTAVIIVLIITLIAKIIKRKK